MQLILAEFCGRWGCSWQENIISLFLASFGVGGIMVLLCLILLPVLLIMLVILTGFTQVFLFFDRLIKPKENITNSGCSKEIKPQISSSGRISIIGKFFGSRGVKLLAHKLRERKTSQSDRKNTG